jgi:hypothetical protein
VPWLCKKVPVRMNGPGDHGWPGPLAEPFAGLFAARKSERDDQFEPDISTHIIDALALSGNCSNSASVVRQKILIVA